MGIVVSVIMGMVLTLPISSAALGIILGLNGVAAGAATIGCCCQMIGFAVTSFKDNGVGGFFAQGIGTSMLQIPNIMKRPLIWLPPTLASAILGPIAIAGPFHMINNATGSGMGTSGLVGQIMTYQTMVATESPVLVILKIVVFHFLLPGLLSSPLYSGPDGKTRGKSAKTVEKGSFRRDSRGGASGSGRDCVFPVSPTKVL